MTTSRNHLRALTVMMALLAGACGGSGTDTSTASSAPVNPGEIVGDSAQSDLPDVSVIDVATDQSVNLRSLAPADKPILLWFYAPH